MRTSRLLTLLGAGLLALTTANCNCGGHDECATISPGTPLASLPASEPQPVYTEYCSPLPDQVITEGGALWCCSREDWRSDGGVRVCGIYGIVDCTKVAPAEYRRVGAPYSDYDCAPDEGFGHPQYQCYVWVRDGGVVGVCGGCPPD